jgi:hypothetical protein
MPSPSMSPSHHHDHYGQDHDHHISVPARLIPSHGGCSAYLLQQRRTEMSIMYSLHTPGSPIAHP